MTIPLSISERIHTGQQALRIAKHDRDRATMAERVKLWSLVRLELPEELHPHLSEGTLDLKGGMATFRLRVEDCTTIWVVLVDTPKGGWVFSEFEIEEFPGQAVGDRIVAHHIDLALGHAHRLCQEWRAECRRLKEKRRGWWPW